ncbi:MAG TPA: hypothetical protein VE441_09790, partial [Mycobacterium sp.]|nr:hypothetical protein [Mycobacterium sp.]
MTYSFRLHGFMGDRSRLDVDASRLAIWSDESHEVLIRSADETPLCETGDLIVVGSGWATEEEAATAGEQWKSAILFGFAHHAVAMSLGTRESPWSRMNPDAAPAVRELFGIDPATRIADDQPGIVT